MQDNSEKILAKIKEFQNQDIYIELGGAIQYNFLIRNAKILVSKQKIFITNEKEQDFIIELYYLKNIVIEEYTIYLQMLNDIKIMLDY